MALQAIAPPQRRRLTKKLLLIMNLTAILLLCGSLTLSAAGFSQKVTLSTKNAKLEKVFKEIKKQTGFGFLYTYELLDKSSPVTLSVKDADLLDVLQKIFDNQPLTWNILEKTVVVKAKIPATEISNTTATLPIDIKGRITNESGEAVPGVSVVVKGGNNGTTTNSNGEFSLINVDSKAFLVISGTNVETVEIAVENRTLLLLTVKTKVSPLDEVQIIAYGTTSQRLGTGNVSTVKAVDIAKQPVNNPLLALQGRVPGMTIDQATGVPGGSVKVRIQGTNSLNRGLAPLYVVDGIPIRSSMMPNQGGFILGSSNDNLSEPSGSGNPLNYINPADIESIDILKDADATAIYGSRAANGAVLITTKKGKVGEAKVNVNIQNGWGKVTRMIKTLNTQQYLAMRKEAFANDGLPIPSFATEPTDVNYDVNGFWDANRDVNWQKELIGNTSQYTDANLGISGGNSNLQFLVSAGYHRETTVFPGDLSDRKASFHSNLNYVSPNQRFRVMVNSTYLADNNKLFSSDITKNALRMVPNAPALYNADGTLNWAPLPDGRSTWLNPLAFLENKYDSKNANLLLNSAISYKIFDDLEFRTNLGYNSLRTDEIAITPLSGAPPEFRSRRVRRSNFSFNNVNSWIIEPQLAYKKRISQGIFEALLGSTLQQLDTRSTTFTGSGFNSDQVMEDIKSAATVSINGNFISRYRYNAIFGRLNYNWQNKYIVNFTARRDGSSRFGSENLFHNFGAVGASWIFSNERAIKENVHWLSFGKIRGSFGTTGNDQIGDYQFLNLYNSYSVAVPYQGINALNTTSLPNPYLQWEETNKLQLGIDLGFVNDRILFSAGYYKNRSSNLLQNYVLPIMTGFYGITLNFPATIQNTGWELSLHLENIKSAKFNWTSNINLTIPKTKLVSFENLENTTFANNYKIGHSVNMVRLYPFQSVDPGTGLYRFIDHQGHPTSSPDIVLDRTIAYNLDPTYFGGFQNNIQFNNFELDFIFQFARKPALHSLAGALPGYFSSNSSGLSGNLPVYVIDHWHQSGNVASVQKPSTNYADPDLYSAVNAFGISDAAYSNIFYTRLKNIALSWTIPRNFSQHIHLMNCRLFIQGQNLLTFTNYKGADPENGYGGTSLLPPLKVITIGIQVTL